MCGWINKLINYLNLSSSSSECSAQGQVFHCKAGTEVVILSKGRSSTANSGTKVVVLQGINRCGSLPLLSAPHSLFSIWTDLKKIWKIPGAPTWRWGEWIWLTGHSEFHWNSPQWLNISSIRFFSPDQRSGNPSNSSLILDYVKRH